MLRNHSLMLRASGVFIFLLIFLRCFSFSQGSAIRGIVLDSLSLEPLAGASVIIVDTKIGTTTGLDGTFVLSGLASGAHLLRVTFVGHGSAERSVILSPDDTISMRIFLLPGEIETEVVVVTGTRTARSIDDVPVRVEAIPEEEIEEKLLMTPSSVAMLLNESTGMRVQTTSSASSTANLRIQGLLGRYTQILQDGIPSLGGVSAGLSLTQLIPLDLRQVEVLKGATSTLYGADAISGVVNFLPKVPGKIPEINLLLNGTTQNGFDAGGFYSGRFDATGVSLLASHNRQERYDVDGDGFADVAEFTRTTLTPRLLYNFSDDLSLRLGVSIMNEQRVGGAMDETPVPGSSLPPYTEKIATSRLDASSHVDWRISSKRTLSAKFAWLHSDIDATIGSSPFHAIQTLGFGDAQYTFELSSHSLLAGAAIRIDHLQDRTVGTTDRSYNFTVPSLFFQDEIRASDRISIVASGRVDFHNMYGMFLVPRFSLMYRPGSSLTLRFGGGTGYKAPTIFVEDAEEAGIPNVRPLGTLMPERSHSGSLDANFRSILGTFTVDCNSAFFLTNLTNALVAHEDSLHAGIVVLDNATGPTRSLGAEISLRLAYEDFHASLGYTYVYATQENNSQTVETELNPRNSFGIVVLWENHERKFKLGLENYWTGSQRVANDPNRTITPAYWITGFIAEKGFGNFRFFVNLENVFDTRQTRYEPIYVGNLALGEIVKLPVWAPLEGRVINGGIRFVLTSGD